jgi:hypothetical protein
MAWLDLAPAYMAGWASCCGFIALTEWLTDIHKQPLADPMAEPHGDVCPWPQNFKVSHATQPASERQDDHE